MDGIVSPVDHKTDEAFVTSNRIESPSQIVAVEAWFIIGLGTNWTVIVSDKLIQPFSCSVNPKIKNEDPWNNRHSQNSQIAWCLSLHKTHLAF